MGVFFLDPGVRDLEAYAMFQLTIDHQLIVRTLHPDDSDEFFQLLERNRPRLRPWIHPSALPETPAATRKFTIECFFNSLEDPMEPLMKYEAYFSELGQYFPPPDPLMELGIRQGGRLVGEIMLSRLRDSYTAAEFGYWLSAESEGKGIITRCVSELMDYAIDQMGIERFVIGCAVENQRSRAIPERLGYRLQATVPHGEVVGDLVYDRVIYGIRSKAWIERRKIRMP